MKIKLIEKTDDIFQTQDEKFEVLRLKINEVISFINIKIIMMNYNKFNNNNGYKYVILSPNNYKLEHRKAVELFLGRELRKDEIIHHIDGDKSNNNLTNLEITNRSKHRSLHARTFTPKEIQVLLDKDMNQNDIAVKLGVTPQAICQFIKRWKLKKIVITEKDKKRRKSIADKKYYQKNKEKINIQTSRYHHLNKHKRIKDK